MPGQGRPNSISIIYSGGIKMLSDIEIAQKAECLPIKEIAKSLSIEEDDLEFY